MILGLLEAKTPTEFLLPRRPRQPPDGERAPLAEAQDGEGRSEWRGATCAVRDPDTTVPAGTERFPRRDNDLIGDDFGGELLDEA